MKTDQPNKKPRVKCKPIEPGQRHGNLVIESLAGVSERKSKRWNCKCDCGAVWIANDQDIKRGKTQRCRQCGDKQAGDKRRGSTINRLDITGQTFGRLTAKECAGKVDGHTIWLYRCKCGNTRKFRADRVTRKEIYSCGCEPKPSWYVAKQTESRPKEPTKPRAVKDTDSVYSKHTPNYSYLSRQPEVATGETKTALIIAARRSGARWWEVAELVDLTVDECKARCPEAA